MEGRVPTHGKTVKKQLPYFPETGRWDVEFRMLNREPLNFGVGSIAEALQGFEFSAD